MKKILTLICTLLCANVLLAQTKFWIGDIQYLTTSNPAKVRVCDANSSITTANIPETVTYQGTTYSVTAIGGWAFEDCYDLTSVTIPNSVTYIGSCVFYNCSSLTSIDIPNSVTSIEGWVFRGCSSLTSVTIPNSVTSIGGGVFYNCSSLTSVTLSNNITSLPASSGCGFFENCSSLTSITIPNSVTSIGEWAFKNCSSLTSIDIPNSVTSIGEDAFRNCSSLTSMTIEMNNIPNLSNIGLNSTLQNLTLGENIASIASGAFNSYSFLQNVTCLATNPPTLEDNTVFPYPNIATLTVPCGSLEAYSSATSFWNMFFMGRISEDCGGESGLEDLNAVEISFFPNPTNSKVTFNQAIKRIELIDLAGKTLRTYENESEINIEQLPAGVYYLRLTNNEKQTLRKLIKE